MAAVAALLAWAPGGGPIHACLDERAVVDEGVQGAEPPFEVRR